MCSVRSLLLLLLGWIAVAAARKRGRRIPAFASSLLADQYATDSLAAGAPVPAFLPAAGGAGAGRRKGAGDSGGLRLASIDSRGGGGRGSNAAPDGAMEGGAVFKFRSASGVMKGGAAGADAKAGDKSGGSSKGGKKPASGAKGGSNGAAKGGSSGAKAGSGGGSSAKGGSGGSSAKGGASGSGGPGQGYDANAPGALPPPIIGPNGEECSGHGTTGEVGFSFVQLGNRIISTVRFGGSSDNKDENNNDGPKSVCNCDLGWGGKYCDADLLNTEKKCSPLDASCAPPAPLREAPCIGPVYDYALDDPCADPRRKHTP